MNSTTKENDWAHAKIRELEEGIEAEVADYNELLEEKEAVERENSENIDDYNKLVEQHNSLFLMTILS